MLKAKRNCGRLRTSQERPKIKIGPQKTVPLDINDVNCKISVMSQYQQFIIMVVDYNIGFIAFYKSSTLSNATWIAIQVNLQLRMKQEESDNSSKERRSRSRSREKKAKIQSSKQIVQINIPDMNIRLYNIRQFTLLQKEDANPDSIEKGYEKYRKDWQQRKDQQFIKEHKNDAWFNQKYHPQLLELLEKERRQNINRNHAQFIAKFKEGFYNAIDLRVNDIDNLGSTYHYEGQNQYQNNHHFINYHILEIGLSNRINVELAPFYGYNSDLNTIFIKAVSKQISRFDIKNIVEKLEGYRNLTMSDPILKANCIRNCYIEFDTQDNCKKALLSINGVIVNNQSLNVSKAYNKIKLVKILKNYPSSRFETDIQTICKLVIKLDTIIGIQENMLILHPFESLHNKFDILLTYLRKVHSFDYFTCMQYQNQRILALKTGSAFLRVEINYQQQPDIQTVFKRIQQKSEAKCCQLINIPSYIGLLGQQIQKLIKQNQKQSIQDVSRCIGCQKKFKNYEFLAKHILLKHQDIKAKVSQVVMGRLYAESPFKNARYFIKENHHNDYRRERSKRAYCDFDEPEETVTTKISGRPLVNFLDI